LFRWRGRALAGGLLVFLYPVGISPGGRLGIREEQVAIGVGLAESIDDGSVLGHNLYAAADDSDHAGKLNGDHRGGDLLIVVERGSQA
jgi:hypothetical protein